MAVLTAHRLREVVRPDLAHVSHLKVAAAIVIFQGAAIAIDGSGNAAIPNGTLELVGIAWNNYDNTGGAITTDRELEVRFGHIEIVSSATSFDIGDKLYLPASDNPDDIQASPTTAKLIGYVVAIPESGKYSVLVVPSKYRL